MGVVLLTERNSAVCGRRQGARRRGRNMLFDLLGVRGKGEMCSWKAGRFTWTYANTVIVVAEKGDVIR